MFRSGRYGVGPLHLLIGLLGAVAAMIWPLTPALASADVRAARIVCALLAFAASMAIGFLGGKGRPLVWTLVAGVAGSLAVFSLWQYISASGPCVSVYEGTPTIVGRDLSSEGEAYVRRNPRSSVADLLFDAGGQSELMWTAPSISRCRFWVSWGGLLTLPLLAVTLGSLVTGRGTVWRWVSSRRPAAAGSVPASEIRYDAFISYRRLDRERAEALVDELESRGFRIAIDFRDFRPNEQVITEMERCIRESRFVLCVITEQYANSGFTAEEASVTRLLDLIERRNRIVPLIFDKVPMPAWMQGLVGIDFGPQAQAEPIDRLVTLLSTPQQPTSSAP